MKTLIHQEKEAKKAKENLASFLKNNHQTNKSSGSVYIAESNTTVNYYWQFLKGFEQNMLDDDTSVIYFEQDLNIYGFVDNIEKGNFIIRENQLKEYVKKNIQSYNEYYKNMLGEREEYPMTLEYMEQYVFENQLEADLQNFVAKNLILFKNQKESMDKIEQMIENVVMYILKNSRYLHVYICREKDRKGIHVWRSTLI